LLGVCGIISSCLILYTPNRVFVKVKIKPSNRVKIARFIPRKYTGGAGMGSVDRIYGASILVNTIMSNKFKLKKG
jgi:hypothetical protein